MAMSILLGIYLSVFFAFIVIGRALFPETWNYHTEAQHFIAFIWPISFPIIAANVLGMKLGVFVTRARKRAQDERDRRAHKARVEAESQVGSP